MKNRKIMEWECVFDLIMRVVEMELNKWMEMRNKPTGRLNKKTS